MRTVLAFCLLALCAFNAPQSETKSQLPKALENSVNFLVIGDWGRKGEADQVAVANAMAQTAENLNANFVLTVGDNFYLKGVSSTKDPHWKASFEDVYHHPSLQIPWYASLGNHDYWGNVQAQINYSWKSKRWHLPSRYYSKTFRKSGENVARILFLDSNPFYDDYYRRHWYQNEIYGHDTSAQLAWMDSLLNRDDYPWEIVVAHHHLASSGKRQGNRNQVENHLKPVLKRNKVKIYFSGHEHHLEHIRTSYGVHNFIIGGGSDADPVHEKNDAIFAKSSLGYAAVSMNTDSIKIWILNEENEILHSYTRSK